MVKKKSKNPSWLDVKSAVDSLDHKQLVKLVADLYRFSKENQAFLNARFGIGSNSLAPYKKIIDDCMYPEIYSKKPGQISKAKKAISNYSKAVEDPIGETELMIFFVEIGNSFTINFGEMVELGRTMPTMVN